MYLPGRTGRPLPIDDRPAGLQTPIAPVTSTPYTPPVAVPPPAPVAPPVVPMGGISGGGPTGPPMGGGSSVPPMFGGFRNPVAPPLQGGPRMPINRGTGIAPGLRKAPRVGAPILPPRSGKRG